VSRGERDQPSGVAGPSCTARTPIKILTAAAAHVVR
jgi:hypothetical protein